MPAFQFPDPLVQQTVKNPITGSTYQWKADPGKWVMTVSIREVGDIVWEGDDEPNPNPGDYKLWYHTEELELYYWYEDVNGVGAWLPTSAPITMLEDLDNSIFELRRDLTSTNIAVRENENRIGRTIAFSDTAPTIFPDDEIEGEFFFSELNYKFWYDTARLELLILFRDEDGDDSYVPVSIPLEALPDPGVSTEVFTYTTSRLRTAIEENYLHNLNQDTSIDNIKNDIIELEEEIDAIAPSVERGVWKFNLGGAVSSRGQITMYDGMDQAGSPIGLFKGAQSVWLNELDSNGTPHGFANVVEGDLLELFVEGDADYGLFTVVATHDETEGTNKYWVIDVEFVRSLDAESKADNADNIRVKIIKPPSAGDNTSYLMKYGDTIDDADSEVKFKWNEDVSLVANENFDIQIDDVPRIKIRTPTNTDPDTAAVQIERFEDNTKSFAIRGKSINGNLVDLLYAYGDGGDEGDGIAYYGKQPDKTNSANIATGGFVAKKVNKAISAAGLLLGEYQYRRNNDSSVSGSIKSNGTTNPKVLSQFDMREQNKTGVWHGKDFYLTYIVVNMFIHIHNNGNDSYVGKITSISELSNGVRIQTNPIDSLCAGNFYVDSRYDVSFSYSKYF